MNTISSLYSLVLLAIVLSITTNTLAQKRVESRGITLKSSIDIRSIPTVTLAELEEHATKLKLLKQGYNESKIDVCRGKRKYFRTNHKRKIHKRRLRSSCGF